MLISIKFLSWKVQIQTPTVPSCSHHAHSGNLVCILSYLRFLFFYFQVLYRTNMVRNIRRKQDACEDDRWISFCSLNKLIRFWPNIWPTVHFLFSCLPKENVLNKMNICYSQHSKILIIYPGFMLRERTKLRGKKNVYVANSLPNNF